MVNISIKITGINRVQSYLKKLKVKIPKASMDSVRELSLLTAKRARNELSRHTELTARLRRLIHASGVRSSNKESKASVSIESEAVFWETGSKLHWVSFYPKKVRPSAVGTPRSKFRAFAKSKMSLSEDEMKRIRAIRVYIPKTNFFTKAVDWANRNAEKIASKHVNRAIK